MPTDRDLDKQQIEAEQQLWAFLSDVSIDPMTKLASGPLFPWFVTTASWKDAEGTRSLRVMVAAAGVEAATSWIESKGGYWMGYPIRVATAKGF